MYKLDMKLLLSAVLFTTTLLTVNGESFQFCVNESITYTEFGENVQVTSRGYPAQYDRSRSCSLALILSTDMPAVLHITQYIPTTADCSVPYAIADSRYSPLPNQYESCSQKDALNIYTNFVPILSNESPSAILILSAVNELADGFSLTLTVTRDEADDTTTEASSTVKSRAETTSTSASPTTSTQPTTSTTQPANDMVVAAVGVGAGIAGFIVGVVVTLLTQLVYRRCRGDTSSKTQTDLLEAADETAPEYMIPTVQLDVLTPITQDVDAANVEAADVTHRYSYVDLPIAPQPTAAAAATTTTSSNEYMALNTASISVADAAEEQNMNDTHLYDKLQNTEER